ncbi:MAG TPA: hypothetical protein PKD37_01020 [Oligoflexia bacterium]|nr:hypothetical protein [Oligoflexia bacterium]
MFILNFVVGIATDIAIAERSQTGEGISVAVPLEERSAIGGSQLGELNQKPTPLARLRSGSLSTSAQGYRGSSAVPLPSGGTNRDFQVGENPLSGSCSLVGNNILVAIFNNSPQSYSASFTLKQLRGVGSSVLRTDSFTVSLPGGSSEKRQFTRANGADGCDLSVASGRLVK